MATTKKQPSQQPSQAETIVIRAPDMRTAMFKIVGTSPLVQHRFANKAKMMQAQEEGSRKGAKKQREAKDFEANYLEAIHLSQEGWAGVPAAAFRNAMISACKIAGFVMTRAKLSVFVHADGMDQDGFPIVRIHGDHERFDAAVRNATGVADVRARPMWRSWRIDLRVKYDADVLSATDIANLLMRAGEQVGIGEGRHDSKQSCGLGFGCFTIAGDA